MIQTLPAPDHVAAFHINGMLTGEEFEQLTAMIDERLKRREKIALYVDAIGLSDVTGDAIAKRVRYGLSKLGELHRFARMAIITDKEWMRAMAGFATTFVPTVEVKTFTDSERDAAMAWASRPL